MKTASRNPDTVVLLSGGLDSTTALYQVMAEGRRPAGLTFDYGQRHDREVRSARMIARRAGIPLYLVRFTVPWRAGVLLNRDAPLPSGRRRKAGVPATYVPARNLVFLSFAVSLAESIGAREVCYGANQVDYSGYPDCRVPFVHAFARAAAAGTVAGTAGRKIKIRAPLVRLSKEQIVRRAIRLGVPLELTWSCYAGGLRPCGVCDSCRFRAAGFRAAGVADPGVR